MDRKVAACVYLILKLIFLSCVRTPTLVLICSVLGVVRNAGDQNLNGSISTAPRITMKPSSPAALPA